MSGVVDFLARKFLFLSYVLSLSLTSVKATSEPLFQESFTIPEDAKAGHRILDLKAFSQKLGNPLKFDITSIIPSELRDALGNLLSSFKPKDENDYRCGLNDCADHFKCYFCLTSNGTYQTTSNFRGVSGQSYLIYFRVTQEITKELLYLRMQVNVASLCGFLDYQFSNFRTTCAPVLQERGAMKVSGFVTTLRYSIANIHERLAEVQLHKNYMKTRPASVRLTILGVQGNVDTKVYLVQEQVVNLTFTDTRVKLDLRDSRSFPNLEVYMEEGFNYVSVTDNAVKLFNYDAKEFCHNLSCRRTYEQVKVEYEISKCVPPFHADYQDCLAQPSVSPIADVSGMLRDHLTVTCVATSSQNFNIVWYHFDDGYEREIGRTEENLHFEGGQLNFTSLSLSHIGSYTCVAVSAGVSGSSNPFQVTVTNSYQYVLTLRLRDRKYNDALRRNGPLFPELANIASSSVSFVIMQGLDRHAFFKVRSFTEKEPGVMAKGSLYLQKFENDDLLMVYVKLNQLLMMKANISGFPNITTMEGDVTLKHDDICREEQSQLEHGSTLQWPATLSQATVMIDCPFDVTINVTRMCSKDMQGIAFWGMYDAKPCDMAFRTSPVVIATSSSMIYAVDTSTAITPSTTDTLLQIKTTKTTMEISSSLSPSASIVILTTPSPTPTELTTKTDQMLEKILSEIINKENLTKDEARNASQNLYEITKPSSQKAITRKGINDASNILRRLINNVADDPQAREHCMDALDNLLQVDSAEIARAQEDYGSASRILEVMGQYGQALALSLNGSYTTSRTKFALGAVREDTSSYNGFVTALSKQSEKIALSLKGEEGSSQASDSSIILPKSLISEAKIQSPQLIMVFTAFTDMTLFPSNDVIKPSGGSPILAAEIREQSIQGLTTPVAINFISEEDKTDAVCGFWDLSNGKGGWSTSGCYKARTDGGLVTCHCHHLTNFALLFGAKISKLKEHKTALTILTYVGAGISILGATITFITYLIHPKLRDSHPPKILMNLVCTLILLYVVFLAGIEQTSSRDTCRAVAILLQYSFLAVFSWSMVEGFASFRGIVRPMAQEIRKFIPKAMIVGWGLPLVLTAIGAGVWPDSYGSGESCVVGHLPLYITVLAPVGLILLLNYCALAGIMCSLTQSSRRYSHNAMTHRDRLRIIVAFILLFGLTWVFGLLVISNDILAFQYIFCVLSGLHGFFVFLFYCVRNENVRKAWTDTLCFRRSEVYFTSSSFDTKKSDYHSESAT